MRVFFHPAAEQDIGDAAAFYEAEGSAALAARFVAEVDRVVRLLVSSPGLGTPRTHGRRGFPTAGFPYTIIYRQVTQGIVVLVVKHDRRRPGHGRARR